MKALTVKDNNIQLTEISQVSSLSKNQVRVKVVCASINPTDVDIINGKYDGIFGLNGKKEAVKTGLEFSGIVVSDGKRFPKGTKVFGYVHLMKGMKTHQRHLVINEDYIAEMPESLSFAQAAALPLGAQTSSIALNNIAGISSGSSVLINGASGGLGVYAIQIARYLGAEVTAIASGKNLALLKELGASHVIDYNETSIETLAGEFEVVLDLTTDLQWSSVRHLLKPKGSFIPLDPLKNVWDILVSAIRPSRTRYLMVSHGCSLTLTKIASWVDKGVIVPVVDSVYSVDDYQQAFAQQATKGKQGRVILDFGHVGDVP